MKNRLHPSLIAAAVLYTGSCGYFQHVTSGTTAGYLDELIQLSQSDSRSQWWPAVQELGRIARTNDTAREEIWRRARVNTLGMKFVLVEPGTFMMGPDLHFLFDIQWPHLVRITRPYYIGVTETTNAQFQQLVPEFMVELKYSPHPDSPAVKVSWNDAERFCKLLSKREGAVYRLPTEAEWEYACRAGTTTRYCFGNGLGREREKLSDYAWWNYTNGRASEVALLKPNNWGIYDMHGNAFEWVSDWYSRSYYGECAKRVLVEDPKGPEGWRVHVLRGGGWQVRNHMALTSTARFPLPTFDRKPFDPDPVGLRQTIGFRVVREVAEGEER